MIYSNLTVSKKNRFNRYSLRITSVLVVAATLLFSSWSAADGTRYRVLLENEPGADEIEAGQIQAGIRMLESELQKADLASSGRIWTNLCAAHIISRSLIEAERTCNKAVEIDPTDYALNNRGVFRVYTGDLSGAREDFQRVRPSNVKAYLERITATNIRLVAASNFDLVSQLIAKRNPAEVRSRRVVSTAQIEDLKN